ncbi:hypothetical protein R6Q57_015827 [Mikania cordata]
MVQRMIRRLRTRVAPGTVKAVTRPVAHALTRPSTGPDPRTDRVVARGVPSARPSRRTGRLYGAATPRVAQSGAPHSKRAVDAAEAPPPRAVVSRPPAPETARAAASVRRPAAGPARQSPGMAFYSQEDSGDDYLFKIVLIGDSAVGKSNLLARFARDEFYPNSKSTIGVEFQTQKVEIKGKEIKAQIWDTAGQERFRAVTSAYYRGAVGALLVYDISRRQTFHSIGRWLNELHTHSDMNVVAILVGNKSDLNEAREVSTEEGKLLAESEGLFFMETSALDSSNVPAAFETVVKEIYNILSRKVMESQKHEPSLSGNGKTVVLEADSDKDNVPNKTWCCSS